MGFGRGVFEVTLETVRDRYRPLETVNFFVDRFFRKVKKKEKSPGRLLSKEA